MNLRKNRSSVKCIIALSVLLSFNVFSQDTITVPVVEDAFMQWKSGDPSVANTNRGSSEVFFANAWTHSGAPIRAKGVTKIDLSSIPSSAIIVAATIHFKAYGDHEQLQDKSNASYLRRADNNWSENTVTWNTVPDTIMRPNDPYLPRSGPSTAGNIPDLDYDVDITDFVKDALNEEESELSMMLILDMWNDHYRQMRFWSKEAPDPEDRPYVTIVYYNTLKIPLSADAILRWRPNSTVYANTNYGDVNLNMAWYWTQSGGNPEKARSVMKVNLGEIPSSAVIANATLHLNANGDHEQLGNKSNACYLRRMENDWEEMSITWNSIPDTIMRSNDPYLPRSGPDEANNIPDLDYDVDITGFVTDAFDNEESEVSMLMILEDESSYYRRLRFWSRNAPDPDDRPYVTIAYTTTDYTQNYTRLKLTMDGSTYYVQRDRTLKLIIDEDYANETNAVSLKIYDESRTLMYTNSSLGLLPGENAISVNLRDIGGFSYDEYYYVEVVNNKNQKRFLRFKYSS